MINVIGAGRGCPPRRSGRKPFEGDWKESSIPGETRSRLLPGELFGPW